MFVCLFSKQMHMSGRRSESLGLPQNGCVDIYQVRPDAVGMLERPGTGGRQEEKGRAYSRNVGETAQCRADRSTESRDMFGLVFAQGVCVMRYWLTPLLAMVSQAAERALQSVCARVMMVSCFICQ